MLNYARSGGTLLNKMLAAHPETVVLSELNPLGAGSGPGSDALDTPAKQARAWYGIEVAGGSFFEELTALEALCRRRGSNLIVRDWSHVNFYPRKENQFAPPNRFLLLEGLKERGAESRPFALVRNPWDVWISRGGLARKDFFVDYRIYVDKIIEQGVPIFRFEELTKDPTDFLQRLCSEIGLAYREEMLQHFWRRSGSVLGDSQKGVQGSRGSRKGAVVARLPRRVIPLSHILKVCRDPDLHYVAEALGYPRGYFENALGVVRWALLRPLQIMRRAVKRIIHV